MWKWYAVLSAFFAACTSILAKVGMKGVDSNLATAIRTVVVLLLAWAIVFVSGAHSGLGGLSRWNWIFLVLSGLATGLSWLFYFKAISMGEVSKVAPIDKSSIVITLFMAFLILGEKPNAKTLAAAGFITAGTFLLLWK
jgi:bacterial/archaeal transporter family protein